MPKIFLLRDQMLEQHQELIDTYQALHKAEPVLFQEEEGNWQQLKEEAECKAAPFYRIQQREVLETVIPLTKKQEAVVFRNKPTEPRASADPSCAELPEEDRPLTAASLESSQTDESFFQGSFFEKLFDQMNYNGPKYNDKKKRFFITGKLFLVVFKRPNWSLMIYLRLSPKCMYASGPPPGSFAFANGNGSSSTGNYFQSNGGSGGNSAAGGSNGASNNNGYYGKPNGSNNNNNNGHHPNNNNNNNGILDFDNFDYPDSPTQKWLADNADLSPLTVLDNINLKTEFPYASNQIDIDKPPDVHHHHQPGISTMDGGPMSENLLQFAVSVPTVAPQPGPSNSSSSSPSSTSFLDIGGDSFTQSLYDDLGDISLNEFGGNNHHGHHHLQQMQQQQQSLNMVPNSGGGEGLLPHGSKPITLEKIESNESPFHNFIHLTDLARIKSTAAAAAAAVAAAAANSSELTLPPSQTSQHAQLDLANLLSGSGSPEASVLKGLMEPLPSSALKGLIKVEPSHSGSSPSPPGMFDASGGFIKLENMECSSSSTSSSNDCGAFSPVSMVHSPASPPSSGGKVKSPSRKKSSSSTSSSNSSITIMTAASGGPTPNEDDDISNIPSLQMRIQIISQRLGIPPNSPIELINGGHGIKNPMSSGEPPEKITSIEKLPPARPESDPSKFQCRICSKIFTLQRLLNRHMKCHSDTKRYLCTFCGKGFNDTFDLKRHTRTHTGVRPYKCNLCEKSFTQRCSLESHCLKVHGVAHQYDYKQRRSKMYVCEDCGHTTPEPEVHYIHLKENHPYSPALLKFYDKRHFKFSNSNFASMLLQVNS